MKNETLLKTVRWISTKTHWASVGRHQPAAGTARGSCARPPARHRTRAPATRRSTLHTWHRSVESKTAKPEVGCDYHSRQYIIWWTWYNKRYLSIEHYKTTIRARIIFNDMHSFSLSLSLPRHRQSLSEYWHIINKHIEVQEGLK